MDYRGFFMKKLIEWLTGVEKNAAEAYNEAAHLFSADPGLHKLLLELSADEALHYKAMLKANECLGDFTEPSLVSLDEATQDRIERPFLDFKNKLTSGKLSSGDLLNSVIILEFCELNHIFLYVVNALKDRSPELLEAARNIDEHKDRIQEYVLKSRPEAEELLKQLRLLPKIGKEEILIVDDKAANISLLKAILEKEGTVESAANGKEALAKVAGKTFSAVITDVDMPFMDGIEFYKKAIETFPELKKKFIFFTGSTDSGRISFMRDNQIKFILKPAPINQIRNAVKEVLGRN